MILNLSSRKRYKCITTLTWHFDSGDGFDPSLEKVKATIDQLVPHPPFGDEYKSFNIEVNLLDLGDAPKTPCHLKEFDPDYILSLIGKGRTKQDFEVDGTRIKVKLTSDRYRLFKKNRNCVSCGLQGTRMFLDANPCDSIPHFNLYGEEDGRLILMTKDHILPKSKGGKDALNNYATMCCICNNLKGNAEISPEQICMLREMNRNPGKLGKPELHLEIERMKAEFEEANVRENAPEILTFKILL